jgi:hypothetical protein
MIAANKKRMVSPTLRCGLTEAVVALKDYSASFILGGAGLRHATFVSQNTPFIRLFPLFISPLSCETQNILLPQESSSYRTNPLPPKLLVCEK